MRLFKVIIALAVILPLIFLITCKSPNYESGRLALKEGNYDKAIKQFNLALEEDPNNGEIYLDLSTAYAKKREWENAVESLEKAAELCPDKKDEIALGRDELWYLISNDVAIPAFNEGEYEDAIKYFEIAVRVKPDVPETYDILGACYGLVGEKEKAVEVLEKAYELDPENTDVINNLSKAYLEVGDTENADKLLLELERLDPDNIDVIYYLGRIAHQKEDYNTAVEKYERVLEINPEHLDALYFLASIKLDIQKENEIAVELFEKFTSLYEEDAVAWAKLARAYTYIGEDEKAIEAAKKAEEIQDKQNEEKVESSGEIPPPPPPSE